MSASVIRTGPAARRALAHDLVEILTQDMRFIRWFVLTVRRYPQDSALLDWPRVMEAARWARAPLQIAEALLSTSRAQARAMHMTHRDCTSGRRHRRRRALFGVRASTLGTCE